MTYWQSEEFMGAARQYFQDKGAPASAGKINGDTASPDDLRRMGIPVER